jgi:hypothetical protein
MKLYHYRRLDPRFAQYLRDHKTYFQSPLRFNDPFDFDLDCLVIGSVKRSADALRNYRQYLNAQLERAKAVLVHHDARMLDRQSSGIKDFLRPLPGLDLARRELRFLREELGHLERQSKAAGDIIGESWDRVRRRLAETYGVVCFSEVPDQLLMWAHYADSHAGVCLEFDSEERPIPSWPKYAYRPVRYVDDRQIDLLNVDTESGFLHLLTSKGRDWQYEREHRLISIKGAGFQEGRLESLTAVVLGARIGNNEPAVREEFFDALKAHCQRRRSVRALSFWAAAKVPGRFSLSLRRLARLHDVEQFLGI